MIPIRRILKRGRLSAAALLAAAALAAPLAGCQGQRPAGSISGNPDWRDPNPGRPGKEIDPLKVETRDDIISIVTFWDPVPWLWDTPRGVVGFRVPVHFVSGTTERGAFVPGIIRCRIYTMERDEEGRLTRTLAHEWEFDEAASTNYRVRRLAVTGYYYGFMLTWPPEAKINGREVDIEFSYERKDGRVVNSRAKRYAVPAATGYDRPTAERTPE